MQGEQILILILMLLLFGNIYLNHRKELKQTLPNLILIEITVVLVATLLLVYSYTSEVIAVIDHYFIWFLITVILSIIYVFENREKYADVIDGRNDLYANIPIAAFLIVVFLELYFNFFIFICKWIRVFT
jgi:hypothetical protein